MVQCVEVLYCNQFHKFNFVKRTEKCENTVKNYFKSCNTVIVSSSFLNNIHI